MQLYWQDNWCKIYYGDSVAGIPLPDNSVELVITSPPYNVNMNYDKHKDIMQIDDYYKMLEDVFKECYRVLVSGGRIAVNCPANLKQHRYSRPAFLAFDITSILRKIGFLDRDWLFWCKIPVVTEKNYNNIYAHNSLGKSTSWGSWLSPSCFGAKTKILMSDFSWKFIKDVKIGDEIIAVYPRNKTHHIYHFCKSIILNTFHRESKTILVNENLYVTPEHLFFLKNKWMEIQMLNKYNLRYFEPIILHLNKDYIIGYLHGVIDGDGNWTSRKTINYNSLEFRISQCHKNIKIIERIREYAYQIGWRLELKDTRKYICLYNYSKYENQKIFDLLRERNNINYYKGYLAGIFDAEGNITSSEIRITQYMDKHLNIWNKIISACNKCNLKYYSDSKTRIYIYDIFNFLNVCKPVKTNFWDYHEKTFGIYQHNKFKQINIDINSYKKQEVFNLMTTTGNYIAEGFIVHNCPYARDTGEYIIIMDKEQSKLEGDKNKIDITKEEFLKYTNNIWHILPTSENKSGHPAAFPNELVYRLLKLYSYQNNTIIDPFAGSGTTGLVAKQNKRKSVMIDISEKYCWLMKQRISQEYLI